MDDVTRYSTFSKKPKPMKRMSDKRAAELDAYDELVTRVKRRAGGKCEAERRWPEVRCAGPLDPHHVNAGMGGRKLVCEISDLLLICRAHHDEIHQVDPQGARERGLLT